MHGTRHHHHAWGRRRRRRRSRRSNGDSCYLPARSDTVPLGLMEVVLIDLLEEGGGWME